MIKQYREDLMAGETERVYRNFGFRIFAVGLLCITLASCTTRAPLNKDVLVRVSNQSGVVLKTVDIGRRIIKANSYSNTNYLTQFKRVNDGETTEYKGVRDTHWGLDRFIVLIEPKGYGPMSQVLPSDTNKLQDALRLQYGIESSAKHPYSGKMLPGYILPSGKYTFAVTRRERALVLEIKKD